MFARHREAIEAVKPKEKKTPWVHWRWLGKDHYGEVIAYPSPGVLEVEEHNALRTIWTIRESDTIGIG